jgi:hypothetical protein
MFRNLKGGRPAAPSEDGSCRLSLETQATQGDKINETEMNSGASFPSYRGDDAPSVALEDDTPVALLEDGKPPKATKNH